METITEILKTHKLRFPWTANDLTDLVNSKRHSILGQEEFINIFKSIGAIEER